MPLIDTSQVYRRSMTSSSSARAPPARQTAWATLTLDGAKVAIDARSRPQLRARESRRRCSIRRTRRRCVARRPPIREFGFYDATVDGGWQIPGELYSSASTDADKTFWWWRARMLGGRTNHWGRISLRNGPLRFQTEGRDGLGFDLAHFCTTNVAPYYDKVEMLIGVYGENNGLENTPNSPDGVVTCAEPRAAKR